MIVENKSKKHLDIIFKIRPVASMNEYNVRIIYEDLTKLPKVYIETLELDVEDKNSIPHNYGIKNIKGKEYLQLCLFYKRIEWNNTMKISDTIVPWASEWLFHFGIWKITGKWKGGGIHVL